jgi:hypothetical protein
MKITNRPVPVVVVSYQKIHFFFTMTQLAKVTTVKVCMTNICWTYYVRCNEISLQWKAIKANS